MIGCYVATLCWQIRFVLAWHVLHLKTLLDIKFDHRQRNDSEKLSMEVGFYFQSFYVSFLRVCYQTADISANLDLYERRSRNGDYEKIRSAR